MGKHRKGLTLEVITFLKQIGEALGYSVEDEEVMFPNNPSSPILDITWRRNGNENYPLFIFEVESSSTKSASDNALKVFSRKTESYPKPLYFFHVFIDSPTEAERIKYLKENYDKLNYGSYLLKDQPEQFRLISDILDQHFRIDDFLDLNLLTRILEENNPLELSSLRVLERLLELGFDKRKDVRFIEILEELITEKNYSSVFKFYSSYLPIYLGYENRPPIKYEPPIDTAMGYSLVTHYALTILKEQANYESFFNRLKEIEHKWEPWGLWEPFFGLSYDHDILMLSEFPLLLTLLCLAFNKTPYAIYFSRKLKIIVDKAKQFPRMNIIHGSVWLLIASQLSEDRDSYEFSRSLLNDMGRVPTLLLSQPTLCWFPDQDEDAELLEPSPPINVPAYTEWRHFINPQINKCTTENPTNFIIESFLVMRDWEQARKKFADYCLQAAIN